MGLVSPTGPLKTMSSRRRGQGRGAAARRPGRVQHAVEGDGGAGRSRARAGGVHERLGPRGRRRSGRALRTESEGARGVVDRNARDQSRRQIVHEIGGAHDAEPGGPGG